MSSGQTKNKRPRTEEVEMKERYVKIVDEGLRKLMGGVKLCREEELTRAVMLEILKSQGSIEEVGGLVEVTVQTMAGASFGVALEEGGGSKSNVRALKVEIKEAQGTPSHLQKLFMLGEDAEGGSEEPLSDDFEIESACTVVLCVKTEKEWEWDAASDLIQDKVFELSGPNNSIATKIGQDQEWKNCMMIGHVMEAGTGKHTISMKLAKGSAVDMFLCCGVVRDGAPSCYCSFDKNYLYCRMDNVGGYLWGNGKFCQAMAGKIESGQVLTMQVDTDAHTLKFWVDGKLHGPGYTSGVTGPLRWTTSVLYKGNAVEIVPTPELE